MGDHCIKEILAEQKEVERQRLIQMIAMHAKYDIAKRQTEIADMVSKYLQIDEPIRSAHWFTLVIDAMEASQECGNILTWVHRVRAVIKLKADNIKRKQSERIRRLIKQQTVHRT